MSEEFEQLKVQLDEKEQLVAALTARLEQAADQLDRIRRTGSDRNVRVAGGAGGSISPEFMEQHKQISVDIQGMTQKWAEMESTGSLARIEHQIGDVRDLIIDLCQKQNMLLENGITVNPGQMAAENVSSFLDQIEQPEKQEAASPAEMFEVEQADEPAADASFDFNALKQNLLNGDSPEPVSGPGSATPAPEMNGQDLQSQPEPAFSTPEKIEEVTPPGDIQFNGASHEQLCDAIEQRDTYIAYLLKKLRQSQMLQISLPDWESLEGVPEELLREAHKLSEQLNEQLRLAEVENAVERARLGREANRLAQLQEKIEKERRRHEEDEENEDEDSQGSSRWMRMLSRGRKQDEQ